METKVSFNYNPAPKYTKTSFNFFNNSKSTQQKKQLNPIKQSILYYLKTYSFTDEELTKIKDYIKQLKHL